MATSGILPFAARDTGSNLLTQAEYQRDEQRTIGHQPGIARNVLENKALRQATIMAAGLAQFIAERQSANITDSMTPAQIANAMSNAVVNAAAIEDVFKQNQQPAQIGYQVLPGGLAFQWGQIDQLATGQYVFPVAFNVGCFGIQFALGGITPAYIFLTGRSKEGFSVRCSDAAGNAVTINKTFWFAYGF